LSSSPVTHCVFVGLCVCVCVCARATPREREREREREKREERERKREREIAARACLPVLSNIVGEWLGGYVSVH